MGGVSRGIDRVEVVFDDPNLVANAGLVVPATLMVRLGLEALVNLELPRWRGHLILGETLEEGGPCGSSSEVPARVPS